MRKGVPPPGLRGASPPPCGSTQPRSLAHVQAWWRRIQPLPVCFGRDPRTTLQRDVKANNIATRKPLETRPRPARGSGRRRTRGGLACRCPGRSCRGEAGAGPLPSEKDFRCSERWRGAVSATSRGRARHPRTRMYLGWGPGEQMSRGLTGRGMSWPQAPRGSLVRPQHREERQLDGEVP